MSDSLVSARDEVLKRSVELVQKILQDEKMTELRKLVAGLNTLEDLCGQPKTSLASLFSSFMDGKPDMMISPDEFYGLDPLEAAKQYLKKLGRAGTKSATFDDIVRGILAGSGDPGNEDKLRLSLARSTYEVVKIPGDRFGLVEFFSHVKRERGAKKKKNGPSQDAENVDTAQASEAENENDPDEIKQAATEVNSEGA